MDRYQHIVRFSTYGHSHSESLHVIRAMNTTDPIGWYMGTGSGTTGGYRNPSFTVFDFDAEYMVPVNAHTYYANLTEANSSPTSLPEWKELHDLKTEYGMSDLSPASMSDFITRMYNDVDLESLYNWNANRRGAPRQKALLHSNFVKCLVTSETFENRECYGEPDINPYPFGLTSVFELIISNWITMK